MVSKLNFLGHIFFLFFPSPQWLLVHHSLPPTILSPSKSPKILNIPSLQSISPISPNCLFVFWANSIIVSYFCVLGFVYIYSFLINGKVKPLFLNNPLSTSTLGICFKFLDALIWVVWKGMTCGKIGGVWSSKHAIFLRDFWSIRKPELKGAYWVISSKTIFRNKILFETSNIKYRFLDCEGSLKSRMIQSFLAYSHCFLEYFLKTS